MSDDNSSPQQTEPDNAEQITNERRAKKFVEKTFGERLIYHRKDGVVHFIAMSTKTQIAFAIVISSFVMWVAYSSVNVVLKEQIIQTRTAEYNELLNRYNKISGLDVEAIIASSELKISSQQKEIANLTSRLEKYERAVIKEKYPLGSRFAKRVYQYYKSFISNIEPENGMKPSETLSMFFSFITWLVSAIMGGIAFGITTVFVRAKSNPD